MSAKLSLLSGMVTRKYHPSKNLRSVPSKWYPLCGVWTPVRFRPVDDAATGPFPMDCPFLAFHIFLDLLPNTPPFGPLPRQADVAASRSSMSACKLHVRFDRGVSIPCPRSGLVPIPSSMDCKDRRSFRSMAVSFLRSPSSSVPCGLDRARSSRVGGFPAAVAKSRRLSSESGHRATRSTNLGPHA
eukprot:scaffold649_cov347-Pavlova_lutheri.AAC.147